MLNITKLENGLRIINEYMPELESVSVNVWVNTGSRNETKKNNGISHFLEHMAFKGTLTRNVKQIAEEFDDIGGRVNAFTSTSKTAYYTKVLKDHTEKAVELLADIFQNSIFLEEEIEKERQVILQELAMTRDDPSDIVHDFFSETQYANQPYGRTIIGTAKNIRNFNRQDLVDYISNQYKTEDIVISFAGNLKNDEAVNLTKKYFNNLQSGKNKKPQKAIYTGGYFAKKKKLEHSQVLIGFESCTFLDEKFYDASVLSIIMGKGMSSRLFQEIREKRGLCYHISAYNESTYDTGSFDIYSAVSADKINELIETTIEEFKKSSKSITEEEFKRAVIKLKSSILMRRESNASRAVDNAGELLSKGKIISTEELIEKIEAVSLKKVKDYIEVILQSKPTLTMYGNLEKDVMTLEELEAIIRK